MNKIVFKVNSSDQISVVSLIKEVNKISCRISINLEEGCITAEHFSDFMSQIEDVIELVNNNFTILSIEIDNTFDEKTETPLNHVESLAVSETAKEDTDLQSTIKETADDKNSKAVVETAEKETISKTTSKYSEESALYDVIGFALEKLDSSKKVEEQVKPFLIDIGMETNEILVTEAFIVACDIKKINYENVIYELHKKFQETTEKNIKKILKETFKNWLNHHPTLAKRFPTISLISMLKIFAKQFK